MRADRGMRMMPLGDSALLAEFGSRPDEATAVAVRRLAAALRLNPLRGVEAIVPAFATVAVHYDPEKVPGAGDAYEVMAAWVGRSWTKAPSARAAAPREFTLPVCYGGEHGPDLEHVAATCRLPTAEVVRRHAGAVYEVRAIGFSPGFPYLAGLPPALHAPRRATPRTRVPAGSVGIGGAQTGIYPSATPGGWNLIGRTPRALFDPEANPPGLLRPGDRVRFVSITPEAYARLAAGPRPERAAPPAGAAEPLFTVVRPGVLTTVQDLGRPDHQEVGVSPGGAVDPVALRVANLLVGNDETAAGLECTLQGPVLAFRRDAWVAVTGAVTAGLPWARPFLVRAGTTLSLEKIERGCRAYLAVAGGIDVPEVLGSRSTLLGAGLGGFEGRLLQAGDAVGAGAASARTAGDAGWFVSPELAPLPAGEVRVRVVRGPQASWFDEPVRRLLHDEPYRVSLRSDRMGLRLEGPELTLAAPRELASEAVAAGSIQVPPDGRPIVLLAERQTIGGYPKIANVVTADLGRLAQLRPGDTVRFAEITVPEALGLWRAQEQNVAWLRAGIRQKQQHGHAVH